MKWWKVVGLAGFAGVAATGVVIARAERRRRAYTPEEIRDRLRSRLDEGSAQADAVPGGAHAAPAESGAPFAAGRRRAVIDTVRTRADKLRGGAVAAARRVRRSWSAEHRDPRG